MSQHPATRPTRPAPRPGPPRPTPDGPPEAVPPAKDLTVNKILAGAGAAATSAVLGSFFGAAGTVAGAALGSVASTVAATIYQRYLDRTRDTLVARIRPGRPGSGAVSPTESTIPMPRVPAEGETVRLRVEPVVPPPAARRRWMLWAGATVLVFVLGLLAVTGIEWVKGSTLTSGDSGTSVGRVLGENRGSPTDTTLTPDPTGGTDPSAGSTPDPTAPPDPSSAPSSRAELGQGSNRDTTGQDGTDRSGVDGSRSDGPGQSGSGATTDAPGAGAPGLLGGLGGQG